MRNSKTTSLTKGLFVVLASLVLALGLAAPAVRAESRDKSGDHKKSSENREARSDRGSKDKDQSGSVTETSETADDSGTVETINAE